MLRCSACTPNPIPTVFSHLHISQLIFTSSPLRLLTKQATQHATCLRRAYATAVSLARGMPDSGPSPPIQPHNLDLPGNRPPKIETYKRSNLELELRWLKDPVKLADHTVKLLREDDPQKALAIVRLASKDLECTVSWNHLIDYEMSKARVANAVKLYNDMKKRAQRPDAYTFTILFRGLSWYPQFPHSAPRALSIYQSMLSENSPVRPSIIHTNVVLKVCALAHDIEALLGIAAELPTRGSGAPDNLTFTTILNAIRSKAFEETEGQKATPQKGHKEIKALAIQQGRRLWMEVRQRWMSGDLHLDEEFVCAMGRLLLLGSEARDHDDVLSLLEQTMGVPRQVARVADPNLERAEDVSGSAEDPEYSTYSPMNAEPETLLSTSGEENDFLEPPSDPFVPHHNTTRPTLPNVRPGRNTLSLVLDACIRLKHVRAAQNYWGLLTSPDGYHKIIPDSENYHMYLRLLRLQRSSKHAVELVEEMKSGKLTGKAGAVQTKTFRIALSCCVRDMKNTNSILHAGKLVRMMTDTLPHPDAKALSMYLQVALRQKPRDWRVIMGVIRGTELGVRNLRSLLAYDPAGPRKQNEEDILELVRGLISAFDVVLDLGNEEISGEERRRCREQKHALAAYVTRTHRRLVVEGKHVVSRKGEDEGADAEDPPSQDRRNERRSDDHHDSDEEGEDDSFGDERDEVGPLKRDPKMAWTMKGSSGSGKRRRIGEMNDSGRLNKLKAWRSSSLQL